MQLLHLRGRKLVDRVRDKGRRFRGKHMSVTYMVYVSNAPASCFLGTSASTKLHKSAVKRNRMRRRCREAFRLTLNVYPANQKTSKPGNIQLLISPRLSSLTCEFQELMNDVEQFLHVIR